MQNFIDVVQARDYMLIIAFINSTILTVASVAIMVVLAAMVAYVLQRRQSRWNGLINFLVLSGLIIPPAVVPTIWVLQKLGLFRTMPGLILVEVAFGMARSASCCSAPSSPRIPRELDEAAIIDGAGPIRLFFRVIFPLLRSVMVTVDRGPVGDHLQRLRRTRCTSCPASRTPPSSSPSTTSRASSPRQYNLLFMNILLITIPPLIMFMFFNRQIVAGMTSGAVKG